VRDESIKQFPLFITFKVKKLKVQSTFNGFPCFEMENYAFPSPHFSCSLNFQLEIPSRILYDLLVEISGIRTLEHRNFPSLLIEVQETREKLQEIFDLNFNTKCEIINRIFRFI
jgi:hypothetical protein